MILLGHKYIPSITIQKIDNIKDIEKTENNSILFIANSINDKSVELIKYITENELEFCIKCEDIKSAIFAHNLGAKYIFTNNYVELQNIANEYLFDSKIIAILNDENEIEDIAKLSIDGVIFKNTSLISSYLNK